IPIYPNSIVKRYAEVSSGVSLVADDKVLAIFLTDPKAPAVYVQPRGTGAKKKELRVGMKLGAFDEVLKGSPRANNAYVDRPASTYEYYPYLGLGARIENGEIRELVLTQVARLANKKP